MGVKNYFGVALLVAIGLLQGCASLTSPARVHEIESDRDKSYWFDYDASRRGAILIPRKKESGQAEYVTCSEPAPDIAVKTIAGLSNQLNASNVTNTTRADISSDVIKLAERTQMVQFLRESLFRLCELSINARLSSTSMEAVYLKILDTALRLDSSEPFDLLVEFRTT